MSIIDDVKSVAKTIQQIDNIELYQKILNLQAEILALVEENNDLKKEVNSLKEKLRVRESLLFEQDAYWIKKSDNKRDGPFCSKCWDTQQQLVRLIFCGNREYSRCPTCAIAIKIIRSNGQ